MFVTICIPSFNRPEPLLRLLNSIDIENVEDCEILICEDKSPKRELIKKVVEKYKSTTNFKVIYHENKVNLGYDKNLRQLIELATGEYIIFMGDDDYFVKGSLDKYISFLKENRQIGYLLKTWINLHQNGYEEIFNYFPNNMFFEPSPKTFIKLFRLSTFISGFTFKREFVVKNHIDDFDGTLLYQLYILGELTINHPSAFLKIPLTIQTKEKVDVPHFGHSESEKELYTPGTITVNNSINFLKGYFKIVEFIDNKYKINTIEEIKKDMTKFSYSYLVLHRAKGIKVFYNFFKSLKYDLGLNKSYLINIYYFILLIFNVNFSNKIIIFLKKIKNGTIFF